MDFVAENFERVIIMAHGQVLADGTAKEVFAQEEALKKARLQKPYVMQLCEALGYERSYLIRCLNAHHLRCEEKLCFILQNPCLKQGFRYAIIARWRLKT